MAEGLHATAAPERGSGILRIHDLLTRFWEAVGISLLWLLGCLPVLTVASSTMALFQVVQQRRTGDYRPVRQAFWQEFKRAPLARAGLSAIVLLALFGVLQTIVAGLTLTDPTMSTLVQAAGLIGAVAVLGTITAALPLRAEFGGSLPATLRLAVAVGLGRMWTMLIATLLTVAVAVAVWLAPPLVLVAGWVWARLLIALSRSAVHRLQKTGR